MSFDAGSIDASLNLDKAPFAKSFAEAQAMAAKGITIPVKIDTSGLGKLAGVGAAGSAAGVTIPVAYKTDQASVAATTAAANNVAAAGRRAWGFLAQPVALFGGVATITAFHLLIDAAVEFAAVIIPATIALGAFGVAAAGPVSDIVAQMQALNTVTKATGQNLYPLTGGFTKFQDSVRPQVMQLFGIALGVANSKMGELQKLATGTGTVLDQLGARAAAALESGGLSAFLSHAVQDVAKLGDIVGNLFGTVGNLLKTMPGYAQTLLNILDFTSKALESITGSTITQHIIGLGLAFHGAAVYIGVAATAAGFLAKSGLNLVASGALNAAIGLEKLGKPAAAASSAMEKLSFGASDLAGLPWTWIAVAAAGIGLVAYRLITAKDATQQWFGSLEQVMGAANAVRGFTMLQTDQALVAGRLATAQGQAAQGAAKYANALAATGGRATSYTLTLGLANQRVTELTNDQKILNDQSTLYSVRLVKLASAFGGVGAAQGILIASGVTMNQMLNKSSTAWLQILQQVQGTEAAYRAMGQTGGVLGADMNAINITASDQVTQMTKLNQAWTQLMGIVSSGQTGFISFEQALKTVNTSAQAAGASMNGLNTPSLTLRSNWQALFTAGSSLVGSLRLMAATAASSSSGSLVQALKLTIAQMLPLGKTTSATRSEMISLAQEVNPNIKNFTELTKWLGNTHDAGKKLNDLVSQMGLNMRDLAKDAANLSSTMQNQLTTQFSRAKLAATGTSQAVVTLGQDMGATHPNAVKMQNDAQILYDKLVQNHIMAPQVARDFVNSLDPAFKNTGTAAGNSGAAGQVSVFSGSMSKAQRIADQFVHGSPYKIKVDENGQGLFTITGSTISKSQGPGGSGNAAGGLAGGGLIRGGTPGRDSVVGMLMPGEVVVPTHLVNAGAVDHLRGVLPGFASGGVAGGMSGNIGVMNGQATIDFDKQFQAKFTSAMESAMTSAMKKAVAAAQAAAAASTAFAHPTGSGATVEALMRSMAASLGWVGNQWTSLYNVEMAEAGFNLNAQNPTSSAYGLAQFIQGPSEYYTYGGNPNTAAGQITGMLNYIRQRYIVPSNAWLHEQQYHWYGDGMQGGVFSRPTLIGVGEKGPERVDITPLSGGHGGSIEHKLDLLIAAVERSATRTGTAMGAVLQGTARGATARAYYRPGAR